MNETDLYYNSFEKYISKNSELKLLDKELQLYKYQKHEEIRKKFIEEAKKARRELKRKEKKKKYMKKSLSSSYVLTQGAKILKNEKIRLNFNQKQQIGELLNIIEREYKREELVKKIETQENLRIKREEDLKKLREKEKFEHEMRDRLQMLKMEQRAKNIREELIRKEKKREKEEKELMLKNELRKKKEEKERKEREIEMKLKEEQFK